MSGSPNRGWRSQTRTTREEDFIVRVVQITYLWTSEVMVRFRRGGPSDRVYVIYITNTRPRNLRLSASRVMNDRHVGTEQ